MSADAGSRTVKTRTGNANSTRSMTVRITSAAVLMAMNIALCSFGIPVPGGHLYLCDAVIFLAALLLGPVEAFAVGGIGAFIGDLLFYPLPMFVSLATHGLQAVVTCLIAHYTFKQHPKIAAGIGVFTGGVIMVTGYTLGKWFIYSTPEYAIIKLPYEIAQAALGGVISLTLYYGFGLQKIYNRIFAGGNGSYV